MKEPGLTILDARPASDFTAGHIQAAVNIPLGEAGTDALPKSGRITVYCSDNHCSIAEIAADKLRGMGHPDVMILDGGISEWARKGFPIAGGAIATQPRPARLSVEAAYAKIKAGTIMVLDVRPQAEFPAGHLPGAKNVPLETLANELAALPKDKDILVYDRQAQRSRKAAQTMLAAGLRVYELAGGLAGWAKKKHELEVK
jgi:rhodanese-related sulfurtransferase